jgi:hypothetical protein
MGNLGNWTINFSWKINFATGIAIVAVPADWLDPARREAADRLEMIHVHDGLGERCRSLLGQIVSDAAGDEAVLILA